MSGYRALSLVYDTLTGNVDVEGRCSFVDGMFLKYGVPRGGIVLDAGCGTGQMTALLADKGYDMLGVDRSPDMLGIAYERAEGKDIRFLCQDLRELDLYGTVVGVVCLQDTLNHLTNKREVEEVLRRFALFTEPGGVLIFDVNTLYKHEAVLADNDFIFEFDDGLCAWRNSFEADKNRTLMTVDVFLQNGARYDRMTDQFYETAYSQQTLEAILERCGYDVVDVRDGESYDALREDSERMMITGIKRR